MAFWAAAVMAFRALDRFTEWMGMRQHFCGGRGRLQHDYDIVLRGALKKWTIWVSKHGTSDNKDTFFFTPDPLNDFICCLSKRST